TTFTNLPTDTLNHKGAITVDPAAGDTPPSLDLGTASDPGNNAFQSNSVDVSVLFASVAADFDAPAVGNTWTDNIDPCTAMQFVVSGAHTASIALDAASPPTTCHN